jgi:hypothetical protein
MKKSVWAFDVVGAYVFRSNSHAGEGWTSRQEAVPPISEKLTGAPPPENPDSPTDPAPRVRFFSVCEGPRSPLDH